MIKFLSVLVILVFSIGASLIPQSSAQESANSTAQYALQLKQLQSAGSFKILPIIYGIFYVTSKDQCGDSENQRLKFYQVLTDEYLSLYGLDHTQVEAACISDKIFTDYFSAISPTVIPIVIVDENVGQKLLIQEGNYGLYTISGIGSESILVCACDNDTESGMVHGFYLMNYHICLFIAMDAPYSVYLTWVHYNQADERCM